MTGPKQENDPGANPEQPPEPDWAPLPTEQAVERAAEQRELEAKPSWKARLGALGPQEWGVGSIVIFALATALWFALPWANPALAQARHHLELKDGNKALAVIDLALRTARPREVRALQALRASALHQTGNHADERQLLEQLGPEAQAWTDPLVLGGAVEDFARREDPAWRTLLERLPPELLRPQLEAFLNDRAPLRQWGALRLLDLDGALSPLQRIHRYLDVLQWKECGMRSAAATRLGELGDPSAEEALQLLKASPRQGKSCGQDQAAAALLKLKKAKPLER